MWLNSGTVLLELSYWNSETAMVEQCGGTVE